MVTNLVNTARPNMTVKRDSLGRVINNHRPLSRMKPLQVGDIIQRHGQRWRVTSVLGKEEKQFVMFRRHGG